MKYNSKQTRRKIKQLKLSSLLIDKGVKTETCINNNVSEILAEFVPSFVQINPPFHI